MATKAGAAKLPISVNLTAAGRDRKTHAGAAILGISVAVAAAGANLGQPNNLSFELRGSILYHRGRP